ncbi:endonuclease domain-containing protein [Microbacterium sp. A588]
MTTRDPLPAHAVGTAFLSGRQGAAGIAARGRLRGRDVDKPFRGIRSQGIDLSTIRGRCVALTPLLGSEQAISHSTALVLCDAPLPSTLERDDADLHVSSTGSRRKRRKGIASHRLDGAFPTTVTHDGIPIVTPATAWCQLAEYGSQRAHRLDIEHIVAVGDFLLSGTVVPGGSRIPPLCTEAELRSAIRAHAGRRGALMLSEAKGLIRAGVDSPQETRLRLLLVCAGLPDPVIHHPVMTRLSTLHPDLSYPGIRLAIEYEGDHHRTDDAQWRSDFERVRALQQAGWTVIRINKDDLNDPIRSHALLAQIRALLASG